MTNVLKSIFCALAFVAFSSAKQLNVGPQTIDESSSSSMSQKLDKRYATQVVTIYLTPSEMQALYNSKNAENSQILIEAEKEMQQQGLPNFNEQQQLKEFNQYNKIPSPVVEPKAELRGLLSHNSFYPKEENNFENQQWNYDFSKLYSHQKPIEQQISYSELNKNVPQENLRYQKESQIQKESASENESEWKPFNPESAIKNYLNKNAPQEYSRYQKESQIQQESALQNESEQKPFNPESAIKESVLKYEQLKQQWNNIFDQNRVQLKALSATSNENQNLKEINVEDNAAKILESNLQNEEKSEIEKQIESILKQQETFDVESQNAFAQSEYDNKRPPIIIHKEVSVTKHLPVPVLKKIKVPTPVLVPVPEPYEVKIPHPYPVPFKIIKHIPVPVVKNY